MLVSERTEAGRPGAVFCSKTGRPLCRGNAHDVLKLIGEQAKANLPDEEGFSWSAHDLRHTFLREVADRYGVHYAKELSGHASNRYQSISGRRSKASASKACSEAPFPVV